MASPATFHIEFLRVGEKLLVALRSRNPIARAFRLLLFVLTLFFLTKRFYSAFRMAPFQLLWNQEAIAILAVCTILTCGSLLLTAYHWYYLLRISGSKISVRAGLPIFFYTLFARYLPGQIWSYLGKIVLPLGSGTNLAQTGQALVLETILSLLAASVVSLAALPFLPMVPRYALAIPLGIIVIGIVLLQPGVFTRLREFGRRSLPNSNVTNYSLRQIVLPLILLIGAWGFLGITLFLLAKIIAPPHGLPLLVSASIYAAAWIVGFLSFWAPAGIGVREAVLVMLLRPWMPENNAILLALEARMVLLMTEVLTFLILSLYQILSVQKKIRSKSIL